MVFVISIHFSSIYTYATELFDTKSRTFAISVCLTIANGMSGLTTYLIYLMKIMEMHSMSFMWVVGVASLVCSIYLPETKNRGIMN